MPHTIEGILGQIYVAFGHGTGAVRVSREACRALDDRYRRHVNGALVAVWDEEGVHALERVRTIGRSAAARTALEGRTAIAGEAVRAAIQALDSDGGCPFCGRPAAEAADGVRRPITRETILGQLWVAMGQGTGPVRISEAACLALRDRYLPHIDASILDSWDGVAGQVLERMRAIGRLAAAEAALAGETTIPRDRVTRAAVTVERISATPICPSTRERNVNANVSVNANDPPTARTAVAPT